MGNGKIDIRDGELIGWMADPYDASVSLPLMRNLAEAPEFDEEFPDHPLSRSRRILAQIEASARLADELKKLQPPSGPPPKRPWWRLR